MVEVEPHRPGEEFAALVNEKLATSQRKDIYIYVHGFRVVFENPLLVGMELWHFLAYDGVAISYAWPSTPSKWAYFSDIESAALAAHHFRIFLNYLAEETEAERIHIIGYSAGTRVLIETLFQLALERGDQDKAAIQESSRIGHVILVGSDFDRELFASYVLDGMLDVPADLTVYLSDTDKALGVSRWLFRRERLGQMWRESEMAPTTAELLSRKEGLVIIDVTDAEKSDAGNGHAYFRDSPWSSSDILATLMYDLSPSERGLVRPEGWPVWSFHRTTLRGLREKLIEVNPDLRKAIDRSHTDTPAQ